jgi:dTMP kinase
MTKNAIIVLLLVLAAGCSGNPPYGGEARAPQMDPARKVSEQDCTQSIDSTGFNLMCRDVSEAERRARIEEEARQARARKEAAERAVRERLERERAEQLAREEAARRARAAEEERLAAERRRLAEEAARKAREERELQERKAAEERARLRAEQEAREAAARECRRLEQERLDGRAQLQNFVATYGKDGEFWEISGQITAFLGKARKGKPCPPAP